MKKPIIATVSALVTAGLAIGGIALTPSAGAAGLLVATQDTNVRLAPNPDAAVVRELKKGETIVAVGIVKDGWHPVKVDGKDAFVKDDYVKNTITVKTDKPSAPATPLAQPKPQATPTPTTPTAPATPSSKPTITIPSTPPTVAPIVPSQPTAPATPPEPKPSEPTTPVLPKPVDPPAPQGADKYATEEVWVRTEPNDNNIIAKLPTNTVIKTTGKTVGIYSEIVYNGALRYVRTQDLADKPSPNTGWSKGLDKLQPNAAHLVDVIREKFPEIATIYGWRPYDPYPDHPSGRAIDLMIPRYKENTELGWRICQYLMENAKSLNIRYLIYQQSYWDTSYGVTRNWKKMSDRGGDTANHYDHIHITTNQ